MFSIFLHSLTNSQHNRYENNHLAVALFDKVVQEDLKRNESFFRVGAFTSKNDAIPLGTCSRVSSYASTPQKQNHSNTQVHPS